LGREYVYNPSEESLRSRLWVLREGRLVVSVGRAVWLVAIGTLLVVLVACGGSVQGSGKIAMAELKDKEGRSVGNAHFSEDEDSVSILVNVLQGIEPGEHGIHVHEKGNISPDFKAAGEHFSPAKAKHGFENPKGPHAGDLKNIKVVEDGTATYRTTTDRVALSEGKAAILDKDGSSLIIHAKADDYETDPDGKSSDPVAAGVIEGS
jgi:Cu-Zn family superoxide dismutase